MTIAYDAGELVGWTSLPALFCRWRGTIFHGTLTTPMFWIVNAIHSGLVFVPMILNEQRRQNGEPELEPLPTLDWGVSTVGMALLFFFM